MTKLEIGGGTNRRAGYVNLDPAHGDEGLRCYVQEGIPLPDCSVEAAYASHVLEHIWAGEERINALNEVWRVLVPGGPFELIVPCVGRTDAETGEPRYNGWQPWADPDHKSAWWFPESFLYLVEGGMAAHADYGLKLWVLGEHHISDGWEAHVTLIKPGGSTT